MKTPPYRGWIIVYDKSEYIATNGSRKLRGLSRLDIERKIDFEVECTKNGKFKPLVIVRTVHLVIPIEIPEEMNGSELERQVRENGLEATLKNYHTSQPVVKNVIP